MKNTNFKIVDCTLRDGGYYTKWDFNDDIIERYFRYMEKLPVDIVEIGYRSIPQDTYMGKYFYLPEFVLSMIKKLNTSKEIGIMFNEKNTRPVHLDKLLDGLKPVVSLIRLAVNPEMFDRAVLLAEEIKKRGFDVTLNLMYMSKYHDDFNFLAKLPKANRIVRYLYIVDSYGGLLPKQLKKLIETVKNITNANLGFHAHNNLELAFANTLLAIDMGCKVVDGTITGTGRGAGNMKIELLLTHLASAGLIDFDFNALSALVEEWGKMQKEYEWGTNLPYMVSGANSLPQKDVMEWVTQRFYSYNSIIRALHNKKLGESDNIKLPVFEPEKNFDNVIIIGGGPSAVEHAEAVKKFIKTLENVCIVHASSKNAKSYEDVDCKQYYCLVGNEGHRLEQVFNNLSYFRGKCILPPYPREMGTYIPAKVKENSYELEKVEFTEKYKDAHTALAFQVALNLKSEFVYLAGYDGYSNDMITNKEQALIIENEYLFDLIKRLNLKLVSILSTNYSLDVESVYTTI